MADDQPAAMSEEYRRLFEKFQETLTRYEERVRELVEIGRDPAGNSERLRALFVQVDELGMQLKDLRTAMAMELFREDF